MPDHNPLTTRQVTPWRATALWLLLFAALGILLTVLSIGVFSWRVNTDLRDLARETAERFEKNLNLRPEVSVGGYVVINAQESLLELATASRVFVVRHRVENTHLFSTKVLEIEAPFTVKAGLDFKKSPLRLRIDPPSHQVTAEMPGPQILSIEMGDLRVVQDESGYWNKLTPQDREEAHRALLSVVRQKALDSSLLVEAKNEAEKRFQELLPPQPFPNPGK